MPLTDFTWELEPQTINGRQFRVGSALRESGDRTPVYLDLAVITAAGVPDPDDAVRHFKVDQ